MTGGGLNPLTGWVPCEQYQTALAMYSPGCHSAKLPGRDRERPRMGFRSEPSDNFQPVIADRLIAILFTGQASRPPSPSRNLYPTALATTGLGSRIDRSRLYARNSSPAQGRRMHLLTI